MPFAKINSAKFWRLPFLRSYEVTKYDEWETDNGKIMNVFGNRRRRWKHVKLLKFDLSCLSKRKKKQLLILKTELLKFLNTSFAIVGSTKCYL